MNSKKQKTSTLPYVFYFSQPLFLTLIGLLNSIYLFFLHYRTHTDLSYISFCAISSAINCDTVAQSPWSVMIGMPVAVWAISAYLIYLIILFRLTRISSKYVCLWCILLIYGTFLSLFSVGFAFISIIKIRAYCIPCVVSYAINFLLMFYPWFIRNRFDSLPFLECFKRSLSLLLNSPPIKNALLILVGLTLITTIIMPKYWASKPLSYSQLSTGITEKGHPWVGAENPVYAIHFFSDYLCFRCAQFNVFLRQLIASYPHKIRVIHHHYPLDHDFNPIVQKGTGHVGSGNLSLFAILAKTRGIFWEANDLIYEEARKNQNEIDISTISEKLGIDSKQIMTEIFSPLTISSLERDIRLGLKYKITATPAFVINDKVYIGRIPSDVAGKLRSESNDVFK